MADCRSSKIATKVVFDLTTICFQIEIITVFCLAVFILTFGLQVQRSVEFLVKDICFSMLPWWEQKRNLEDNWDFLVVFEFKFLDI